MRLQLRQPAGTAHDHSQPDPRLPLRWAVILTLSGACGLLIGHAEGIPAGVLAFLTAIGVLYQIVRDR